MYVLMITPNKFPEGDAGAVRDFYFAKIYESLGYEIIHIGMNPNKKFGTYKNIEFYSLYENNNSIISKVTNTILYRNRLDNIYRKIVRNNGNPSLIHIYDIPEGGVNWAKALSQDLNIPILHDSVEWYSACEFKYGHLAYPYILKNRTNEKLIVPPIRVYSISTYLLKHFENRGLKTIRIPVIMDKNDYQPNNRENNNIISVVYAGSPAKKDYLDVCIKAFCNLPDEIKARFKFTVLGADEKYVDSCCIGDKPKEIVALGRVERHIVVQYLENADFSILLRPSNERYTKAGFPTKSVEALMNGCALLCNLSSDLGLYLQDAVNAIIVNDSTIEAMEKGFMRASELTHLDLQAMRNSARETAEKYFDYRNYIDLVREFIETN